jgi:hypothetical protein
MKRMMVRYKVKPDRVAENERSIVSVFEQLNRAQPIGLRYASARAVGVQRVYRQRAGSLR